MTKIYEMMPDLQGEEMAFLQSLTNDYNEEKLRNFSNIYRARRKDPQLILLLTLLGFIGFAGVHRFILNQIGMAILCFYTAGLCLIATILDLLNYKCPAFNSNGHVATEINTRLSKLKALFKLF
jgi:TM2 domain-containing membrane protein YozV